MCVLYVSFGSMVKNIILTSHQRTIYTVISVPIKNLYYILAFIFRMVCSEQSASFLDLV